MRRLLAFVLHATAASVMAWGWHGFVKTQIGKLVDAQKGGHSQYLTFHGLVCAWSCMTVSLFCDVFPSVAVVRHLKKVLLMMSLPLAFIISGIYWSLLLFQPNLITPPTIVEKPPLALDLSLHASPLLALSIDFFVFETKFSTTYVHKVAPLALVAFTTSYVSFVEHCATFNGTFPYPFLTHSSLAGRVLIYIATAGVTLGCFRMLNTLHA